MGVLRKTYTAGKQYLSLIMTKQGRGNLNTFTRRRAGVDSWAILEKVSVLIINRFVKDPNRRLKLIQKCDQFSYFYAYGWLKFLSWPLDREWKQQESKSIWSPRRNISKMIVSGQILRGGYRIIPESLREMHDMATAVSGKGRIGGWCEVERRFAVSSEAWAPDKAAKEIYMLTLTASHLVENEGASKNTTYKCPEDDGVPRRSLSFQDAGMQKRRESYVLYSLRRLGCMNYWFSAIASYGKNGKWELGNGQSRTNA